MRFKGLSPIVLLLSACSTSPAPALHPLEITNYVYLAGLQRHLVLSPTGVLRMERIAITPGAPAKTLEVREGKLTAEQMTQMQKLLIRCDGQWNKTYPGVADGPEISIQYGTDRVSGQPPEPFTRVTTQLLEFADQLPVEPSKPSS